MKHRRCFTAMAIVAGFMAWKAPLGHAQEKGKSSSVEIKRAMQGVSSTPEGCSVEKFSVYSPSMGRGIDCLVILPPEYKNHPEKSYPILYAISAAIACAVEYADADDRSLQTVRELLSDPQKIGMMTKLLCESTAWDGLLARQGFNLTHYKDKELASTLTTTNRFLRFLDTPAIVASTRASSFDPAELLTGKMTVYLILPPEHMRTQSALLRMWISTLMRSVVKGGLQTP